MYVENNKNNLMIFILCITLGFSLFFGYDRFYLQPKENNANTEIYMAEKKFEQNKFQEAYNFAYTRLQGQSIDNLDHKTVPIVDHPDVKRMLLDMKSRIEAMRALTIETANFLEHSKINGDNIKYKKDFLDLLTPIVKAWCTDQGVVIDSTGIQVDGGM